MCSPGEAYQCTAEPELADVLDDPVVQAVMTRDGVGRDDIVDLATAVRQKFGPRTKNSPSRRCE